MLSVSQHDLIIDFGCRKGKALYHFSHYNFKEVDGVVISEGLAHIDKYNLKTPGIKNSEVFISDVLKFINIHCYNYFYFYNPFPEVVLKSVINI